jgi:GNAT superfamily N-acetyltransferase
MPGERHVQNGGVEARVFIEPRIINLSEYFTYFKDSLPAISTFYARKSASVSGGFSLGAFRDGEPLGALSAGCGGDGTYSIYHFGTVESHRNQGVSGALLGSALSRFKSSGLDIAETGVSLSDPCHEIAESMLKKNAFKEVKTLTTVINHYNEDNIADFYDFKRTKGDRLAARLAARGCRAKSFAESGARGIQALKDAIGVAFPAVLSPFRNGERLLKDLSFIIFRDGGPAAYCAMTQFENVPGASEVSSMASSPELRHSGVGMWALFKCLEAAIESKRFKKTLFTFESGNMEMANLKDKPPTRFRGSRFSVSRIYRLRLRDGE